MLRKVETVIRLLVVVGLLGCAYRGEVAKVSNQVKGVDKDLLKRVEYYWGYRKEAARDISVADLLLNEFEAPHVKEMIPRNRYEKYIKYMSKSLNDVYIDRFLGCDRDFYCCFDVVFGYSTVAGKTYSKDCWVKVDGKWYHVLFNPLFFPELQ